MTISALFISLTLLFSVQPSSPCYARLENDTLKIGNNLIERSFIWNGGHLKTVSLTNKETGKVLRSAGVKPDLCFTNNTVSGKEAVLTIGNRTDSDGQCFKATVEYCLPGHPRTMDTLWVRRVFKLYQDVPAVHGQVFLRGSLPDSADEVLDRVDFIGRHWKMRVVSFNDATDNHDNLVNSRDILSYKRQFLPGNIVFSTDAETGSGYYLLKEAPCTDRNDPELGMFAMDFGSLTARGWGVSPAELSRDEWTEVYATVLGVFDQSEYSALVSLRKYMKTIRRQSDDRDEMIMMNTWGDRSRDAKLGESFCIEEIKNCSRLGITHFQIDDGWQKGKSPASSKVKGSFDAIWETDDYWTPDLDIFPNGLAPVVSYARTCGIETGLWFNPSNVRELADWEKDANTLINLFKEHGIRYFKVDGLQVKSKEAEDNLRKFFERVRKETQDSVVINLDVTAGYRPGYFFMGEYGNIFLENRYTDFASYYPYKTLRNLWQLARYFPPERLQVEFLNKWRNQEKYPSGDRFAPAMYDFSYLFAITMPSQPLAWFEASNLPEEAFLIAPLVNKYRSIMAEFHKGIILPVGNEPDGRAWTGFQSVVDESSGFLLVFREDNQERSSLLETFLPEGVMVRLTPIAGDAKKTMGKVLLGSRINIDLPRPNSFALFRYEIIL